MFNRIKNLFRKKVYLYLVYKNEDDSSLVTVLEKEYQIDEFIHRNILVHNYKHFKAWCDLRQLDYTKLESENAYVNNFLDTATEEDLKKYTYIIKKVYYTKTALASILRMFNGCFPLGCSYETEVEVAYVNVLFEEVEKVKQKEKRLNGSTTN